MRTIWLAQRLARFRNELAVLWRSFIDPGVPLHLKALILIVPLYLLSPIDLIPDFIPILGWLDDAVIVPMLVGFIARMLGGRASATRSTAGGRTIDGTARRV